MSIATILREATAISEGAPADGPIEAVLELVNYLDNTLWRFDRIIET